MNVSFKRIIVVVVIATLVLTAIAVLTYLSGRDEANQLVLSGTIEADEINVGSRIGGRIAAVLVEEGQAVKAGQPLIRFEAYDLEAKEKDARAAVAEAEANLEKMNRGSRPEEIAEARAQAEAARVSLEQARNGPRPQEVAAARADLEAAEGEYQRASLTLKRIGELSRTGVASRQDYDNAKADFDRAKGARDSAEQKLALLLAGTRAEEIERAEKVYRQAEARLRLVQNGFRREDIDQARAQLERARAALEQIGAQIGELEVDSPGDANVDVLRVRPGDLISAGSPVATLVELDRLYVRVFVPEPQMGHVQPGKQVQVRVDSFNESFNGVVEHLSSRGEFTPRNVQTREEREHQVFAVRVRIDNSARKLRAGMAADVSIAR